MFTQEYGIRSFVVTIIYSSFKEKQKNIGLQPGLRMTSLYKK